MTQEFDDAVADFKAAIRNAVTPFLDRLARRLMRLDVLAMRMLCDGCDREKRFTTSVDGRTLVCPRCRARGHLTGVWRG